MKKILMISLIWGQFIFLSHNLHAKSWPPKPTACVTMLQIPLNMIAYYGAGTVLGPLIASFIEDEVIKQTLSHPQLWIMNGLLGSTTFFSIAGIEGHPLPYGLNLALNPGLVASARLCEFFESEE